eukprot:PhM_4_TR11641/c2_g2_i1/m.68198
MFVVTALMLFEGGDEEVDGSDVVAGRFTVAVCTIVFVGVAERDGGRAVETPDAEPMGGTAGALTDLPPSLEATLAVGATCTTATELALLTPGMTPLFSVDTFDGIGAVVECVMCCLRKIPDDGAPRGSAELGEDVGLLVPRGVRA